MNLGDYGVLRPLALLLLVAIVAALALCARGARLRAQAAAIFGVTAPKRHVWHFVTIGLTGLLLTAALIRPYWGSEDITISSQGEEIVFLVDISRSMLARDVPPSRIELAKRKIKDMIQAFAAHGLANRYAITVFAGDGYTVCPMTSDTVVVKQFVDIISPELEMSLGSDLKAGVTAALAGLTANRSAHARIILLSDGEDQFLDQASLIADIRSKGLRFDVLGFGTSQGATINLPNGAQIVDNSRNPVTTILKEESLRAIARAGGGEYRRATLNDSDIASLTRPVTIPSAATGAQTSTIRSYREIGPWFAFAALMLLLIAALSRRLNPFIGAILFSFFTPLSVSAQPSGNILAQPADASARHLYESGEFEASAQEFSRLLTADPANRAAKQGLASALYKSGKFSESQKLFRELATSAKDGRDYFEGYYNEGNAWLSMGRYKEAIDAYDRSLLSKPNDPRATQNRSIAEALLEHQKRAPSPTPTPTPASSESSPTAAQTPSPQPTQSASQSPESEPTRSETPSAPQSPSPGPSPSPDPQGSATPNGTATPSQQQASQTGQPTPHETAGGPPEGQTPQAESPAPTTQPDDQATEADAWLQSLPDSPLFVSRHRGRGSNRGQTW